MQASLLMMLSSANGLIFHVLQLKPLPKWIGISNGKTKIEENHKENKTENALSQWPRVWTSRL